MNRRTVAALSCLPLLLAGCLGENTQPPVRAQAVAREAGGLSRARPSLEEERIEQFGFKVYWDSYIRDEVITSLTMEGDQLYAFTESNRLYQVDVHSGMVNWVYDVGRELSFQGQRAIAEWLYTADDKGLKLYDEIFFCAEDHLYALDKKNGSLLWTVYLGFTPSSPPEASASHVFVGAWDDRIYAVRKDRPEIPDWSWRSNGDLLARPVYKKPTLFVPSADGNLYAFDAVSGRMKWPFGTERKLTADPILFKSLLYVPSDDYNLYVLGADDGLVHHRFSAGAPITTRPVAIENTIYVGAGQNGMYAVLRKGRPQPSEGNPRKIDHAMAWQRKGATQVLCKGVNDVYLLEPAQNRATVSRIDAKEGHFRDAIDFTGVDYWATNAFSPAAVDRDASLRAGILFLGFRNGWIVALKETATIPGA